MAKQPTLDEMRLALTKVMPKRQRNANLKKFLSPSKVKEKLYHATPKDFKEFQGQGFDPTISGNATWLSTDPKHQPAMHNISGGRNAEFREGTNVMPVHVQAKTPLYLDDKGMIEYARAAYAKGHSEFPDLLTPETVRLLKEDGYDSIIHADPYKVGRAHEIIMLEPKRIKSAIGNRGTYDPNNPDITKAKGGEVLPHHQREANKAKFLKESAIKERLFHGTNNDIVQFDPNKAGKKTGNLTSALGTFLSDNPEESSRYAELWGTEGGNVMPVIAQLKNPYVMPYSEYNNLAMGALNRRMKDPDYDPNRIVKPDDIEGQKRSAEAIKRHEAEGLKDVIKRRNELIKLGHDSIVMNIGGNREVVAFDPRKIKSAIGNRGTYDITDPDITKAKGGEVKRHNFVKHKHGEKVGGYDVGDKINNYGSYASSGIDDIEEGIHRVPMSAFEVTHPNKLFYAKNDIDRVHKLAEQIKHNKYMDPLLVAMDKKGAYVLEGGHRLGAAHLLGMKEIPAMIGHEPDDYAQGGNVNPKYPSIEEMLQKLREAGRTPVMPAPDRWFKHPQKHPFQQKAIEKLLAHTGHAREDFPFGAHINPITGEPLDFEIMNDLGVAIDPNTGNPMMSGIKSGLTEIDPKLGSLTKSNLIRKGLFKHEGGDPLLDRIKFLATIEKSGKGHHYGLSTQYASPAELVQEMTGNPTLRPHSRGDIYGVGDEIGRISIKGKHHPVYEKLLVAPFGSDVQGKKLHKAKGGGIPPHIKASMDQMKAELQAKVAQDKAYHHAIRKMPFDQIPTFEQWKQSQPTHAHHLEIEERPL